jgi:hypothetical protein
VNSASFTNATLHSENLRSSRCLLHAPARKNAPHGGGIPKINMARLLIHTSYFRPMPSGALFLSACLSLLRSPSFEIGVPCSEYRPVKFGPRQHQPCQGARKYFY